MVRQLLSKLLHTKKHKEIDLNGTLPQAIKALQWYEIHTTEAYPALRTTLEQSHKLTATVRLQMPNALSEEPLFADIAVDPTEIIRALININEKERSKIFRLQQ